MLQNAMVVVAIGHHWVPFVGDTEDLRKERKGSKKEQKRASPRLLDARFAIYAKNAAECDGHRRIWTSLGPFRGRDRRSMKTAKKKAQSRANGSKKEQTRADGTPEGPKHRRRAAAEPPHKSQAQKEHDDLVESMEGEEVKRGRQWGVRCTAGGALELLGGGNPVPLEELEMGQLRAVLLHLGVPREEVAKMEREGLRAKYQGSKGNNEPVGAKEWSTGEQAELGRLESQVVTMEDTALGQQLEENKRNALSTLRGMTGGDRGASLAML